MRRASIYKRNGRFLVHASSGTTAGVWILSEPYITMDQSSGDRAIGEAVSTALSGSRTNVAHPQKWSGLVDPLLKLAGVKSWAAFSKNATLVELDDDNGQVSIVPTKNLGAKDGFEPEASRAVIVSLDALEDLGREIRRLLE